MQESIVSVRGQTVIPKEVRDALGIKEGSRLKWVAKEQGALIYVVPEDPVRALRGILKDTGYTFEDFIRERNEERKRERTLEEKEAKRWQATSSTPQQ
jgi:AbrB family looped-hinge helix DNA binding protein